LPIDARQLDAEHRLIEKLQRTEGLILRARRHVAVHRQFGEKHLNLGGAHSVWMARVADANESHDPIRV
jgi:hypothetical protein